MRWVTAGLLLAGTVGVVRTARSQQKPVMLDAFESVGLDAEFLALDPKRWETLSYVAQRQERLPEEKRTQYVGQEVAWQWQNPKTRATEVFRRLYVISSEERATCRKVR